MSLDVFKYFADVLEISLQEKFLRSLRILSWNQYFEKEKNVDF